MPAGLQIWDANGAIVLDTPNPIGRFLGVVMNVTANGSVTNAKLATGRPFAFPQINFTGYEPSDFPDAILISFSGTTLSWTFFEQGPGQRSSANIFYGVF